MSVISWFRNALGKSPPAARPLVEPMGAYRALFGEKAPIVPPPPAPPLPAPLATRPPVPEPPVTAKPASPDPVTIIKTVPHEDDLRFRTPDDLAVTDLPVRNVLIVGSCLSAVLRAYMGRAFPGVTADHVLYNNPGTLPDTPPQPLEAYDFQIVMLALRTAMPEQLYFPLGHNNIEGYEAAFATARERLGQMLHGALAYRDIRPLTTFVTNYALPQQNLLGRLLPRYDLRNPVYFIEQLNRVIADEIAGLPGVHLVDVDQISANYGRKYAQDDVIQAINHHSVIGDYEHQFDLARIEPPRPITAEHVYRASEFVHATCYEIRAMYRTLRQVDQVKLVIVDLDDTLWRGVIAEEGIDRPMLTEGWPIGFVEALIFLKKRGILLAIVSKNDEARIRDLWQWIYRGRLELSDFAAIKINWEPKADNVEQILKETNLLPRSVVFIDDNPVERANVATAFPGIRLLGGSPYTMRRVLLWAAETQVAYITDESARRTEMIQAQVQRETTRSRLTRGEFLETLDVSIRLFPITGVQDPRFARAFELVNKSNQFNTTGRRWSQEECQAAFARGAIFWAFEVDDRFTKYGVVGVLIAERDAIEQFVMSCRVVGLEVEIAVIAAITAETSGDITARFTATDANFLCRDLYGRCGFTETAAGWTKPAAFAIPRPAHIRSLERVAIPAIELMGSKGS